MLVKNVSHKTTKSVRGAWWTEANKKLGNKPVKVHEGNILNEMKNYIKRLFGDESNNENIDMNILDYFITKLSLHYPDAIKHPWMKDQWSHC